MEVLILEVPRTQRAAAPAKDPDPKTPAEYAGVMPQRCSETWMESNCKGARLGIFGGAGFTEAPPTAAADWSPRPGEVNRSRAVSQRRGKATGSVRLKKWGGITAECTSDQQDRWRNQTPNPEEVPSRSTYDVIRSHHTQRTHRINTKVQHSSCDQ